MRITIFRFSAGLFCGVALAATLLPSDILASVWSAPPSRAVSQIAQDGIDKAGDTLNMAAVATGISEPQPIDFDNLIKFDEPKYKVEVSESVSTDMLSRTSVRKIGYGHETSVTIVRTPTGTYSSDGLVSPHVLYPGIKVTPVKSEDNLGSFWSSRYGWMSLSANPSGSIINYGRTLDGGRYITNGKRTCVSGKGYRVCS